MDGIYLIALDHYKFVVITAVAAVAALIAGLYFFERRRWRRSLMKSQKFCRKCGGSGKLADKSGCDLCGGTGIPPVCPICGGDGKIDADKRCSYCMGTGVVIM